MTVLDAIRVLNERFGERAGSYGNCGMYAYAIAKHLGNAKIVVMINENTDEVIHVLVDVGGEMYDNTGHVDEQNVIDLLADDDEIVDFLEYANADEALSIIKDGTTPSMHWQEFYSALQDKTAMAYFNIVDETIRTADFKSALHLRDIPEKFRGLKVLGRGKTSIVLEKDEKTVIMLTIDSVKKDWLTRNWGIEIGTETDDSFEFYSPRIKDDNQYGTMHVIELPRLYKPTGAAKKRAQKLLQTLETLRSSATNWKSFTQAFDKQQFYENVLNAGQLKELDPEFVKMALHLAEFMLNYGDEHMLDLHMGNVMQDADGNLILLDPLISRKMFNDLLGRIA